MSECSLDAVSFSTDDFSMGRNGKHFIKPVPDVSLTLRPPIKERAVPESTTPEAIKMGRFYCTAEEVGWLRKVTFEMKQLSNYKEAACKGQSVSL